jgi:signal transduction histidine kinase
MGLSRLTTLKRGLSGRVLLLTILFVMLGEVLIFLPSIANFRIQWMKSRIAQAEIAALAAEAAPDQILDADLRTEILKGAGVTAVSLQKGLTRRLMLRNGEDVQVEMSFDLRSGLYYDTIGEALAVMLRKDDHIISVSDFPPNMSGDLIEVAMHEQPMRTAMLHFALNVFGVSIVLSLIVASLIFAALDRLLVRPIRHLSGNMLAFGTMPEDPSRLIVPSGRNDEIGTAEHELRDMQSQLQGLLQQKSHLAELGLAVSKVSHDLRNMLTSAQLISDRLAEVRDPTVQRFAPKLISSLDRAIAFLTETITYGRAQEATPRRERLALSELVDEVCEQAQLLAGAGAVVSSLVKHGITVDADREQLIRILTNLARNAVQALASRRAVTGQIAMVSIAALRRGNSTVITVSDTGPGIPAAMRGRLFEAFQSADRQGGTGLGLAIAAELARAHLGTLECIETGPRGTSFAVTIPDAFAANDAKVVPLLRLERP